MDILKKLEENFDSDEYRIGGGVTKDKIQSAEQALNMVFPVPYKEFLSQVGWLEVINNYFFGVASQDEGEGSVVRMTHFAQQNWDLPEGLIVIYSSADKLLWCMASANERSSKIVGYDTSKQKIVSVVSEDFESLIADYLDQ